MAYTNEEQIEDLILVLDDDMTTITSEEARDLAITFEDALEITYGLDNDDKIMLSEENLIKLPEFMKLRASVGLMFAEGNYTLRADSIVENGKVSKKAVQRILEIARKEHDDFFYTGMINPERENQLSLWGIPPNILGINKVISWCEDVL